MSDLLNQIRSMSPEEKAELSAALKDLEPKPEPQVKQLGTPLDRSHRDLYGRKLSPEEVYDQEHPLDGIWPYGYRETFQSFGHEPMTKYFTDAEVAAHNEPIIQAWLEEKRKHFPDAKRPSIPRISDAQNHYRFSR